MKDTLWEKILGHQSLLVNLRKTIEEEKVGHAYLFAGPQGVGKHYTATFFAAALNCEQGLGKACGVCSSCRAVLNQSHPDVFFFQPEGNFITIDQIREIQHLVGLKVLKGRRKVVLIDQVDSLNLPAANSFLRTLEEPPPAVVFVLITSRPEALLSTIFSRCQLILFRPLSPEEISRILQEKFSFPSEKASFITQLSRGILSRAVALAENSFLLRQREVLKRLFTGDLSLPMLSELVAELARETKEQLQMLKEEQEKESHQRKEFIGPSMGKKEEQRHKRELNRLEHQIYQEILTFLILFYRDLLLLGENTDKNLISNIDFTEELKMKAKNFGVKRVSKALALIQETRKVIVANVSPLLALENLLFNLSSLEA